MFRPDSLTLGAYVDGELDAQTAADVEAAAAHNPAIRHELDRLLRLAGTLRIAYDDPLHAPVPDHLVSTILDYTAPASTAGEKVITLPRRDRAPAPRFAWAAAAAVALVVGFSTAQLFHNDEGLGSGEAFFAAYQAAMWETVNQALETLPNGEQAPIAINSEFVGSVTPLRTYVNAQGRYCRDYAVQAAITAGNQTACRTDKGEWKNPTVQDITIGNT
ncbi:MAG: hypothetical protein ACTSX7_13705 [Alphaproteobacteria bacterium]